MASLQALRDDALTADVREALAEHVVLRNCAVNVSVRGGVAHVSGRVQAVNERELLRRVIGRVRGVHAVWDSLPAADGETPRVVDIGCGNRKQQAESIGVDCLQLPAVDVVARLERGLPFADAAIDHVYAIHCLEHVVDLVHVMNEIHRVLKPDGMLHVMVPRWQCVNAIADPTHCRLFHRQTFKYFCAPRPELRLFRPAHVAESRDDLYADLQPIKHGGAAYCPLQVARFFD